MHSRIRTTAGLSALLALLLSLAMEPMARARDLASQERQLLDAPAGGIAELLFTAEGDDVYESTFVDTAQPPAIGLTAWNLDQARSGNVADDILPLSEPSSDAPQDDQPPIDPELFEIGDGTADPSYDAYGAPDLWFWKVMPNGVIYHSYMAGVHEPRMAFVPFYETEKGRTLWDATLGGRAGVLRYGNCDPYRPQGWQLDMEGAVMVRLDVENRQDLDGSDYRFGFPITYGIDNWQIKFGYYHISSHLGDERMLREPGLVERINYVRDGFLYGVSYYPVPYCRVYGEVGGAFHFDGGAEPIELQFGTELSQPGPTTSGAVPFFAVHGHLRQDHDFGGDLSLQTGWLWRGDLGQTMRLGGHYFNGKSSQFQFFDTFEQQVGFGIWYDY